MQDFDHKFYNSILTMAALIIYWYHCDITSIKKLQTFVSIAWLRHHYQFFVYPFFKWVLTYFFTTAFPNFMRALMAVGAV